MGCSGCEDSVFMFGDSLDGRPKRNVQSRKRKKRISKLFGI